MTLAFPLTGIDATYATPSYSAEIVFAQGPSTAGAETREVCFVMPKTSAGAWTAATMYRVRNEGEVIDGAGPGSPLHRGIRKFMQLNKDAKVWAVPVAETSGGSPVAATAVLTIATTATGTGTISVTICGEICSYTFLSGETATNIGDGIVAAINAKTHLPCTAANATGTVTLTAKLKGTSQGTGSLGVIRVRSEITAGVATTASFGGAFLGTGVAGAEGTTTEAASTTTALAALDAVRKYYLGTSGNTSTILGLFKSHIVTKSEPRRGLRSVFVAGYTGSLASCQTLATGLNYERGQIAWQVNSEHDCAELAGIMLALRQKGEARDSAYNFNLTRLAPYILPPYAAADRPDGDDVEDAILDGISPIASDDAGAYLVQSLTTRSKNAAGTVSDRRVARTNKVSVPDEFTDSLLIRFANNFGNKKFLDDERLADGSVNPNQRAIRDVVRPSMIRGPASDLVDQFYAAGKLQSPELTKSSMTFLKAADAPSRCEGNIDLYVIDWLDQVTTRVAETSAG